MPAQSRSRRQRQSTRQQQRATRAQASAQRNQRSNVQQPGDTPVHDELQASVEEQHMAVDVAEPAPAPTRARTTRQSRRARAQAELEPIDYTADYAAAAHDMRRILIWSLVLFGTMIALALSGII